MPSKQSFLPPSLFFSIYFGMFIWYSQSIIQNEWAHWTIQYPVYGNDGVVASSKFNNCFSKWPWVPSASTQGKPWSETVLRTRSNQKEPGSGGGGDWAGQEYQETQSGCLLSGNAAWHRGQTSCSCSSAGRSVYSGKANSQYSQQEMVWGPWNSLFWWWNSRSSSQVIIAVTFAAKLNWPFPQSVKISNGKH